MDKTIQMMKDCGMFDSMVRNIMFCDMSKDAVAGVIDKVCEHDENFEDVFFNDLHEIGMDAIWGELTFEVTKRKAQDKLAEAEKQDTIEGLLKKLISMLGN